MRAKLLRNVFLVIFLASTLFLLLISSGNRLGDIFPAAVTESPVPIVTAGPNTTPTPNTPPSPKTDFGALIGSLITSITSLVGFITTTVITWRREKREASLADMERKKLETELEKSKLELEELKKGREKKDGRRKK